MGWHLVKRISGAALALLVFGVIADILVFNLVEYGSKPSSFSGCHAYDAMLVLFGCQGFWGSPVIEAWLNWALYLLYAPIFALVSLKSALVAVLVWAPIILFVVACYMVSRKPPNQSLKNGDAP
jgi:hypothetical protein